MTDSRPGSAPVLPTLLGGACNPYRARSPSFLAALLLQTTGLVALVWLIGHFSPKSGMHPLANVISGFAPVSFLPTRAQPSGGGGGGDRSKTVASKGALLRMTLQDQLAPPQAVLNTPEPKLPELASIVAITDTRLPQLGQWGNPLANVPAPPSNGSGERGGLGSDCCGGVGATRGRGFGDSDGRVYKPGVAGVSFPRAIYDPDPEYSEPARRARRQGSVVLVLIVDAQGQPRNLRLQRSLGMGLDEKAMAALSTWRFQPATLHGRPVATQINVEVTFRLF